MKNDPWMYRFSILVVSLNAGDKLLQTINSIREQTFSDYEVIVKDGGSRDHSIERLRGRLEEEDSIEFGRKVKIYVEPDTGIYDGMNQAAGKASGEYFLFLNCGDLFYDNKVLVEIAARIDTSGRSMKGDCSLIFYGDIYDILRGSRIASNPRLNEFACYRNVPCHQACIYHRSLFAERGYETRYRVRADYEHFLWCFFAGKANPVYLQVVVASYEGGGFSETKENRRQSEKEHKEITAKYISLQKRIWYRLLLLASLAPLRTKAAENPRVAAFYNQCKRWIYREKREKNY